MNEVYELDDGRSLTLYMEGNRILALVTPLRRGALPSLLKTDCLGKLYSTAYRGSIYYVYENLNHQIVMDTIPSGTARVLLSPTTDASRFDGLMLREISGRLCLLYQAWNPLAENYNLCCQSPISQEAPEVIYKAYSGRLRLQWLECEDGAYMLATPSAPGVADGEEDGAQELWFKIEDGHFFPSARQNGGEAQALKATEAVREAYEARLAAEKAECEETIRQLRGRCALLESAGADYEARLAEITEHHSEEMEAARARYSEEMEAANARHSEALSACEERCRKELADAGAALKALEQQKNLQLKQLKEGYEAQLDSAKKQYAELAKTAVELQKVGRLWRDKYLGDS